MTLESWQLDIVKEEKAMSNEDLLLEVMSLHSGDRYNANCGVGYFTERGKWKYDYLYQRLFERLDDCL